MNEAREHLTSEILWCPDGGRLVVTLPDAGRLIRCQQATDTFVEVLKRIGIENVKRLNIESAGIPLISTTDYPDRVQREEGAYYIAMGMDPDTMANRLRQIAEGLGISLFAELFPADRQE